MREFWVLVKKELRSVRREKTIMFAIIIQIFIAGFSSILLIGMTSFYDPSSIGDNAAMNINVGVVGEADSAVAYFVDQEPNITVYRFSYPEEAEAGFRSGMVDAIMGVPPPENGVVDMKLILPRSDAESMLILMTLDQPLQKAENYLRQQNGIELHYADLGGKQSTTFEFLYAVIIPVLMFFPALIAGSITVDTISEEMQNKTLDTLWAAPLSLGRIFSSKIFAAVVTALVQCILWVILLRINSFAVSNIAGVLTLAMLIAFCVSFGAGIIALFFRDRDRAQFVFSIVLVMMAGLSYLVDPAPFELMTRLAAGSRGVGWLQVVSYLLPLAALSGVFFLVSRRLAVTQS